MSPGKIGVVALVVAVIGGFWTALAFTDDDSRSTVVGGLVLEEGRQTGAPQVQEVAEVDDPEQGPDPTGDGTLDDDGTNLGNNGGPNSRDGDRTAGNDGTRDGDNTADDDGTRGGNNGGDNSRDRDRTAGNDGTNGGANTGDGDNTAGNDGTRGGDNTYVPRAAGGGDTSGGGDT